MICPSDTESAEVLGADVNTGNNWVYDSASHPPVASGDPKYGQPDLWKIGREGDASYIYLGFAVKSNEWLLNWASTNDLVDALATCFFLPDIDATITHPLLGEIRIYRLREGIERFFITDINNPAASAMAQSELAVYWDCTSTNVSEYNHVPGGANVLYMDGHAEFISIPRQNSPVTEEMATISNAIA